jgi:hypothetical protein
MKIITKNIRVYKYSELPESIKDIVINNEVNFMLECFEYDELSENMKKAIDKSEQMQTPWFAGSYIWDYARDEILERVNQQEYTIDGNIFTK